MRNLGLVMMLSLPGIAEETRITIGVYTFAQVPAGVLSEAKVKATRIFQKAGIEAEWVDCPVTEAEREKFPSCQALVSPSMFSINIITRSMSARYPRRHGELGFAALDDQTGYGSTAYVFFHRVEEEAWGTNSDVSVVLANAMAHELGHLLLGAGGHSRTGIMRGTWDRDDVKRAARGELVFTPQQARQMQERNHRRQSP